MGGLLAFRFARGCILLSCRDCMAAATYIACASRKKELHHRFNMFLITVLFVCVDLLNAFVPCQRSCGSVADYLMTQLNHGFYAPVGLSQAPLRRSSAPLPRRWPLSEARKDVVARPQHLTLPRSSLALVLPALLALILGQQPLVPSQLASLGDRSRNAGLRPRILRSSQTTPLIP
jgi:hypothetical protein